MLCDIHDISRPLDPLQKVCVTLLNTTNDVVMTNLTFYLGEVGKLERVLYNHERHNSPYRMTTLKNVM